MKIVLIGIQGSGKSTQGNLLSEKLGLPYLSSGHILRNMAKEKTRWGRYVKETLNAGVLIPDEKMTPIMEEYLKKPEYSGGWILDGYPRTVKQGEDFKENIDAVIYVKVSDAEALGRLSLRNERREDDTVKAIKKRIESFHTLTEPIIDYYRKKGILMEIDGERTIEEIHNDIMERLSK